MSVGGGVLDVPAFGTNAFAVRRIPCIGGRALLAPYGCGAFGRMTRPLRGAVFALLGDGSIVPSGMIDPYGCGVFGRVTRPLRIPDSYSLLRIHYYLFTIPCPLIPNP